MSATVSQMREWLATLDDGAEIAVDDGGLTIVEVGGSAYFDLGGIPDPQSSLFDTQEA